MNIIHNGRKDIQSLVVRDLLVAQRKRSEKIRMLYQNMEWIGFISGCSIRGFKGVPALAPGQAYELRMGSVRYGQCEGYDWRVLGLTVAPRDQISVGVPHFRFSIASGLRKIAAPMMCPSSLGCAFGS